MRHSILLMFQEAQTKIGHNVAGRHGHATILIIFILFLFILAYLLYVYLNKEQKEEEPPKTVDTEKIRERILNYLHSYRDSVFKHYLCTVIFLKFDIDVDRQKEIEEKYPDYRNQLVRKKVEDIIEEKVKFDELKKIMKEITEEETGVQVEYEYPADYMHFLYEYEELKGKLKAYKEIEKDLNEEDKKKNNKEIEELNSSIEKLKQGSII